MPCGAWGKRKSELHWSCLYSKFFFLFWVHYGFLAFILFLKQYIKILLFILTTGFFGPLHFASPQSHFWCELLRNWGNKMVLNLALASIYRHCHLYKPEQDRSAVRKLFSRTGWSPKAVCWDQQPPGRRWQRMVWESGLLGEVRVCNVGRCPTERSGSHRLAVAWPNPSCRQISFGLPSNFF